MRKCYLLLLCIYLSSAFTKGYSQDNSEVVIGTKHHLYSETLSEQRSFWVNLPASYSLEVNNYKRYPVLILLDGDAHFMACAGVARFMSASDKIPEMIVVGIKNVNRERDYTPDKIETVRKNDFGGGDNFLAFLEKELIPELDRQYRTEPYRILSGHSLGGLLAVHTFMKKNTIFNGFISIDPSLGTWDEPTIDKKVGAVSDSSFGRVIYIASANSGSRKARNEDRHVLLFNKLKEKGNGHLVGKFEYFENEDHRSVPLIAWHQGLSHIFEGYKYFYSEDSSINDLKNHYDKISSRLFYPIKPPERLINRIGYRILYSRNQDERMNALDYFRLNTSNYPASYNAFDSLAEAYAKLDNAQEAIVNYKKSLLLNPENDHAKAQIKILSEKK